MKIHEYGIKNGPVIVLIHAKYSSAKYMEQYIEPLKEHYHIIMPDMSGHGEDVRQYRSTKEDARELADWLVDKGYEHLRLVFGQSLGGQMAMYLVSDKRITFDKMFADNAPLTQSNAVMSLFMTSNMKADDNFTEQELKDIAEDENYFRFPIIPFDKQEAITLEYDNLMFSKSSQKKIRENYPKIKIKTIQSVRYDPGKYSDRILKYLGQSEDIAYKKSHTPSKALVAIASGITGIVGLLAFFHRDKISAFHKAVKRITRIGKF